MKRCIFGLTGTVSACGIPTLAHEGRDDAVELGALEALYVCLSGAELPEILCETHQSIESTTSVDNQLCSSKCKRQYADGATLVTKAKETCEKSQQM